MPTSSDAPTRHRLEHEHNKESAKESVKKVVNTERASASYYRDALRQVLKQLGWQNVVGPPSKECDVVWSEDPTRRPKMLALPRLARTNRFFGMILVCRKVSAAHPMVLWCPWLPSSLERLTLIACDVVFWSEWHASRACSAQSQLEAVCLAGVPSSAPQHVRKAPSKGVQQSHTNNLVGGQGGVGQGKVASSVEETCPTLPQIEWTCTGLHSQAR